MKTIIRKRLFCILLACCFLQFCLPLQQIGGFVTTVFAAEEENYFDFAGGTGTAENPYRIETMFHLNNVRHYLDAHFIQMNDIDLTEATADNGVLGAWQSIGTSSSNEFTGSYDGGGKVIKGLQGNSLFDYIGETGVVQNLGMIDSNVNSYYSGGIAGRNSGTINNCYNTSNITSDVHSSMTPSGGISSVNNGIIRNCYNTGNIHSTDKISGGIVGINNGIINNCYNTGNVTSSCSSGGIVGENSGTIDNSYTLNEIHFNEFGVKLTIEQMKQQNYFTGFDFDTVWTYDTSSNYLFPVLKNIKHIERKENIIDFNGGNGTLYNPYEVATEQQLDTVRNYWKDCFMQVADIDLTEETAEGGIFYHDGNGWTAFDTFTGNYNGDTHTITGLQTTGNGLFSINSGVVQNLGMVDGNVTGSISGGIAGENSGTISNCYNTGNITTTFGGIAGENRGTINSCYNTGNATADSSYYLYYYGGIAGKNSGTISNCYNTGNATVTTAFGGIAGENSGTISNCYNTGNITSKDYSGGIAGSNNNNGIINNCFNTGSITSNNYSGGIAGDGTGTIKNCYNTGIILATSKYVAYSGGIVGGFHNYSYSDNVSNCYNIGKIIVSSENDTAYAGGLVGRASNTYATISTSYSIGEVSATGATTRVGKVVGMNEGATLSRLYYIGTSSDFGVGNEGNGKDRVEFRTAEQMKTPSSLTGFDFETVWAVDEDINNGFPYLQGVGVVAPPIEQPKNELERSIDNVTYDSGKQAYTFTVEFINNTNNAITTNVFAAAYDNSGRMTGLAIYDLTDLAAGSGATIDAVISAPQTAAYIKIICMDSNTLAPVGAALKEEV